MANVLRDDMLNGSIKDTAETILANSALKDEIVKIIQQESHNSLKSSLKDSLLCANKNNRQYLLSLTPRNLVQEFKTNSSAAFLLLVQGLLGISDPEEVFENQYLLNNICFVYSSISKVINRKATGYALLMTTAVRDGGLREDSIKLFSMLVHPRTSQKYDKDVLADGWDQPLNEALAVEREHFQKLHDALQQKSNFIENDATNDEIDAAAREVARLLASSPQQVQIVWDNLNLRSKHKFERKNDEYAKSNFDWMASMFVRDRIDVNHMKSSEPVRSPADLKIEDFVPTESEKEYVFESLVCYYASRLVHRHPLAYKSINASIKPNKPHQFQTEMDSKSDEYTGRLFTKSECVT